VNLYNLTTSSIRLCDVTDDGVSAVNTRTSVDLHHLLQWCVLSSFERHVIPNGRTSRQRVA